MQKQRRGIFAASLLFAVGNMFDNILDRAVKNAAQGIEYHGLDDPVLPQSLKLGFIYPVILYELVLTDILSLHRPPQRVIAYQCHHLTCILA